MSLPVHDGRALKPSKSRFITCREVTAFVNLFGWGARGLCNKVSARQATTVMRAEEAIADAGTKIRDFICDIYPPNADEDGEHLKYIISFKGV